MTVLPGMPLSTEAASDEPPAPDPVLGAAGTPAPQASAVTAPLPVPVPDPAPAEVPEYATAPAPAPAVMAVPDGPAGVSAPAGLFASTEPFGEESETANPGDGTDGPRRPRSFRVGGRAVPGRLLALLGVLLIVVVGGGGYFLLHSSSDASTQLLPPVHHAAHRATPAHAATKGKKHQPVVKHQGSTGHRKAPAKHHASAEPSKARDLAFATTVFSVLPAQLAGWQPRGTAHVNTSGELTSKDRRQIQSLQRCSGVSIPADQSVAFSQAYLNAQLGRYGMQGQGEVDFFRSAANARRNIALMSNAKFVGCAQSELRGLLPRVSGATFSSFRVKPLHIKSLPGAHGIEGDATIQAPNGVHGYRFVEIEAQVGRQGIEYNSAGAGRVQSLGSDLQVLRAMLAKARATTL